MKYQNLHIQTQREFPNNARTQGFGWLVRAGYLTRENEILPLGQQMISRLQNLSSNPSFFSLLSFPIISNEHETFFPLSTGSTEIVHCDSCKYTERLELAQFKKTPFLQEQETQLPVEKVSTPDCNTIESLANFLNIPKRENRQSLDVHPHIRQSICLRRRARRYDPERSKTQEHSWRYPHGNSGRDHKCRRGGGIRVTCGIERSVRSSS